jgi:IS5 family transposase
LTLASVSFDKHSKQTRRAVFLSEMDQLVPWRDLCAVVEPFYRKAGNGRPPVGLERMMRLHFL